MYYVEANSFSAQIKQYISHFALLYADGLLPLQHIVVLNNSQSCQDLGTTTPWFMVAIHPEQHVPSVWTFPAYPLSIRTRAIRTVRSDDRTGYGIPDT